MTAARVRGFALRIATPTALALAIAFFAAAAIGLLQGEKPFYADALGYWQLAEEFSNSGHFSLLSFPTIWRGFALPLTFHLLRQVAGVFTDSDPRMVIAFNALLFSVIATVLAPRLAQIVWPKTEWGLWRRLTLAAIVIVFWRGFLNFPLSDFPALAVALIALIAVAKPTSPGWMLAAGLAAGLAMNFRPAYLLLVPITILFAVWDWFEHRHEQVRSDLRRLVCLALLAIGVLLITVPQSLISHRVNGSYSPLPGGSELANLQYTEGLEYQRLDAVFNDHFQAVVVYSDPDTTSIVAGLKQGGFQGTGEYLGIVAHHPLTMAGVFLRHAINALDQRYPTPYVEHLEDGRNRLLRIGGFLLVFLALVRLFWPSARRSLGPARWRYAVALLVITVPALTSGAVTRLLLPVFVLCALLALSPGWPNPVGAKEEGLRRFVTPLALIAAAALFAALVITVVDGASDHMHVVPIT